ncbi:restriction endonuclease subunit S [Aeribacillus sp. FSL K6-8394]|uniref:restriction endonuclease subunit S n=1 Tax=Aeribacillus sp. FSL K6-8394 TaxID=2954570 RepID=UPI0030FB3F79
MAVIYKKLGEIADISAGGTPKRSNPTYWKNGNIPWVKISDVKGKYLEKTEEFITEDGLNNSSAKLFKKGTLLYTIFATIGECAILNIDASTNQAIAGINVKSEKVLTEYLYYFLKSIKNTVANTGRGVAQNNINLSILKNIDVPLPEIEVQKKIINLLNKSNELVIKRKAQIEALDQLTQSVFLEMFGDPVLNKNNYNVCKLSELCIKITDGTHHSPPMVKEGIPYITAKHLGKGYLDFYSDPTYVSLEDHKKIYSRCNPVKGDVLYIKDGATTGIAGINHYDFEFSMLSSLALIKVNPSMLNNYYLVYYLNNKGIFNRIIQNMSGGAIKRLTIKKINDINIVVPPIHLQNKFAELIVNIEGKKQLLTNSLKELQNNYYSIMQRAFKGELFTEEKVSNL